jgi:hypothetical protein
MIFGNDYFNPRKPFHSIKTQAAQRTTLDSGTLCGLDLCCQEALRYLTPMTETKNIIGKLVYIYIYIYILERHYSNLDIQFDIQFKIFVFHFFFTHLFKHFKTILKHVLKQFVKQL